MRARGGVVGTHNLRLGGSRRRERERDAPGRVEHVPQVLLDPPLQLRLRPPRSPLPRKGGVDRGAGARPIECGMKMGGVTDPPLHLRLPPRALGNRRHGGVDRGCNEAGWGLRETCRILDEDGRRTQHGRGKGENAAGNIRKRHAAALDAATGRRPRMRRSWAELAQGRSSPG